MDEFGFDQEIDVAAFAALEVAQPQHAAAALELAAKARAEPAQAAAGGCAPRPIILIVSMHESTDGRESGEA